MYRGSRRRAIDDDDDADDRERETGSREFEMKRIKCRAFREGGERTRSTNNDHQRREREEGELSKAHTKCLPTAMETTCHVPYGHTFVTGLTGSTGYSTL